MAAAHRISHITFIFLSMLLSFASFQRAGIYKDEFGLWANTAGKSFKVRPHNNLGRAHEAMGKTNEALKEYSMAVRAYPRYAPSHSNLAGIYIQLGRLDDAEAELNLAIVNSPPFEDLHRRLGFVLVKKGLLGDARMEFEKAMPLIPDHPDARRAIAALYTNEAWPYTDKGDFSSAVLLHMTAASVDPSYADARYGLALDYEALGQNEEAIKQWQKYLGLAPPDEPFRKNAVRHLERLKKWH